jgi:hypothetical protein
MGWNALTSAILITFHLEFVGKLCNICRMWNVIYITLVMQPGMVADIPTGMNIPNMI